MKQREHHDVIITPLEINNLHGRSGFMPSSRKNARKRIVLVYGLHSSIERMQGTVQFLSDYGDVYVFDLPGIGGMDSFYSIGREPTLDNYADYLYTALRSRHLDSNVTIVAMSFGFIVATRMLQKYPLTQQWFETILSFVGFGRVQDFREYKRRQRNYLPLTRLLSTKTGSKIIKIGLFNRVSLAIMFRVLALFNPKYKHAMDNDPIASFAMERKLWQTNDTRTRFYLYTILFTFDLTSHSGQKIAVPLHDLTTPTDQYFDADKVSNTLKTLYERVSTSSANMPLHAPSIMGDADEIADIFSVQSKKVLGK